MLIHHFIRCMTGMPHIHMMKSSVMLTGSELVKTGRKSDLFGKKVWKTSSRSSKTQSGAILATNSLSNFLFSFLSFLSVNFMFLSCTATELSSFATSTSSISHKVHIFVLENALGAARITLWALCQCNAVISDAFSVKDYEFDIKINLILARPVPNPSPPQEI